ncbi:MAG: glycosyltransferase [Parcubacteria group bacterium]|nr:glycosyltransferase [Parcubacteria group bacterium]
MKGVILAGGSGTRLAPFTHITNKHLLPIYDKPVIFYAIEKLVSAGIDHIMIVTPPEYQHHFVQLVGSGQNFISPKTGKRIQIVYGIQDKPSGIADGLHIAKEYVGNDNCVLYLGDNIFEDDISEYVENFKKGALVFLKEVNDPERFGVATIDGSNNIIEIEEKPKNPKSNKAVTGVYLYDNTVFEKMLGQQKSGRGEYEITHINNKYIEDGALQAIILEKNWFDIGTTDSLLEAGKFMQYKKQISARVPSLSIVFPCFNDKGTIATMIVEAKKVARSLTNDFEIIVVDDYSTDGSQELLLELKNSIPELKLIFHHKKQGYGATLRSGFAATQKDIVCYTEADASYDIRELPKLLEQLDSRIDIVSGYKIGNVEPFHRIIIDIIYRHLMKLIFWLSVKDPDCDFRLMRRAVLDNLNLESESGVISVELLKKAQNKGFKFAEVGVSHYFRMYGKSQALNIPRIMVIVARLAKLWIAIVWFGGKS